MSKLTLKWAVKCNKVLKGRTITSVRYMTDDEMNSLGWYSKAIVIQLDDGNLIFPSADDEGNDAGALFTNHEDLPTIPVIRD
jgi:hypothetical protein